MAPPKLIKDNKVSPLRVIGSDGNVRVEIGKDKHNRTSKERRFMLANTVVGVTVIFISLVFFIVRFSLLMQHKHPHVGKEVSKEDSEMNKFYNVANTFWSYTQYKDRHGKDIYKSSARGFFIGLDKNKSVDILDDLEAIEDSDLSFSKQNDYAVLQFSLRSYIEGYEWIDFGKPNYINFLDDVLKPHYWNHQRETETGYALQSSIVHSVQAEADVYFLMQEMLKSIRQNRTNHNASMVRVPDMIGAHLSRLYKTSRKVAYKNPLYYSYMDKYASNGSIYEALTRFQYVHRIKPIDALLKLKKFIANEYIPAGRPGVGVNSYDRGDEYYAACLRHFVSKNVTVDEVRNTGIKEVARIKELMKKIMTGEGFNGTLRQYFTYLSTERVQDFYNRTEDELLSGFRTIINNRINPKLQEIFYGEHIPNQPIRVQAMEQDLLPSSYADSVFSPNLWRPKTRPTFLMMAVALHESNPGRHLQATYNKKHFDLPYRHVEWPQEHHSGPSAVPAFTSYVEGWGSYAEYLGEELGLYNSSKLELFGRHSEDMLRACRLVTDTGIHAFGMTRAEAIEYLQEHVAIPKEQIEIEVDRVITWPGQASSYKMGEMTILELRREAERVLGELFEIKDFHKTVLDVGRVPLGMLEDEVRVWIWKTKPAPKKTRSWSSYMCDEFL